MTSAAAASLLNPDRLEAVRSSGLLDTPPDEDFDRLTRLAARTLRTPIAAVSLIDGERQFLKSQLGIEGSWASHRTVPLEHSICRHVVAAGKPLVLRDLRQSRPFRGSPGVRELGWIAYAGFPLLIDGLAVGTFCVLDRRPRSWSDDEVGALEDFAATAGCQIQRAAGEARGDTAERSFRALIELSLVGICLIQDDRILYTNPTFREIFGYSQEELAALSSSMQLVAEEDRAAVAKVARQRRESGNRDARSEYRGVRRDGSRIDLEAQWVETIVDGRVAILGTVVDVTERKSAEAALRESEERLRLVSRATNDVTWDWDLKSERVRWSDRVAAVFQYAPEEVEETFDWWYGRIHPEDRARVVQALEAAQRGSRSAYTSEYRFRCGDGSDAVVLDRGFVVLDERNRPVRMLGAMMDVTERRAAEERQRLLADASAVLDKSLDYVVTLHTVAKMTVPALADYCLIDELTDGGEIHRVAAVHADPEREALLRRDEHLPLASDPRRHPSVRVLQTGRPVLVPEFDAAALAAIAHDEEHRRGLRALGLCSYMIVPISGGGRTLGAITFASAQSGRRYGPADLSLAEEVARRSGLAIENARLYRDAQLALQARDDVVAVVSHDLRNPLNVVTMGASLLLEMPPQQRAGDTRVLERILGAARQMNSLIRDLLEVAKIEAGRFVVEPEPEDPRALLHEAAEFAETLASPAGIRVETIVDGEIPDVSADRERILQVFSNLIGNAVKFTPAGGTITLALDVDAGVVRYVVRDTGRGIAADRLPRIFDRFWQESAADRRGAGLGLAIVRGIVQAHGGSVSVASEPGTGTCFAFTLPAVAAQREGSTSSKGSFETSEQLGRPPVLTAGG